MHDRINIDILVLYIGGLNGLIVKQKQIETIKLLIIGEIVLNNTV
jgi:hypothetical protein